MHVQKHLQFVGRNEKLLLWCAQMTKCCGGWTNSYENFTCDQRNALKQLRKTVTVALISSETTALGLPLLLLPLTATLLSSTCSPPEDLSGLVFSQHKNGLVTEKLHSPAGCFGCSLHSALSSSWLYWTLLMPHHNQVRQGQHVRFPSPGKVSWMW